MATRAVSTVITYRAWDTSANAPKTGDVANHTLRWVKDGTSSAPANSPAEVDSTNAKGIYKITMTSTETDCTFGVLAGVSSTANVAIFGVQIGFDYVPTSAPTYGAFIGNATAAMAVDGSGRVTVGSNADKTGYSLSASQTFSMTGNITGNLSGSVGSVTGAVGSVTSGVTVSTNSDKTGYTLTSGGIDAILDQAAGIEANITPRQGLRLMLAALAGKLSGAATTSVVIRDTNDVKNRISATVDANGNRTALTYDLT